MDLSGIIKESQLEKTIQIGSKAGQKSFTSGLYNWSTNPAEIIYKASKINSLRITLKNNPSLSIKLKKFYDSYIEAETTIETIIAPSNEESNESKSQLVFTNPNLKPLNFAPFLLLVLYIMKTFITPTFALLMPFILIATPFLLIKYIYKMDIEFSYYWSIIQNLIIKPSASTMQKIQHIGYLGWIAVGIGQNMIQPLFNAMHIYRLNKIYYDHYILIANLYNSWKHILLDFAKVGWSFSDKSYASWFKTFCTDSRMFLAGAMEPLGLHCWIREIGNLEVLYHFATTSHYNIAKPLNNNNIKPYLKLINAIDPQIELVNRKPISLTNVKHSLLTGPNRGGKSTVLRSILVNVLLAQTYGVCLAQHMQFTPFHWIHSCLRLEDIPGTQSLFEREVWMAARSLRRLHNQPNHRGLILIDELFHSTNPSDSNRAAKIYTTEIWKYPQCLSIISTHDFDLVHTAPSAVQPLCCPATLLKNNKVQYSYSLKEGICEISSVDEILMEKGVRKLSDH
jgi:hypothetical protein